MAALSGAASGALASTSVGIVGMVAGNAAISSVENVANQVIENEGFDNFCVADMLVDAAIGGVAGAIGGLGKGTKHMMTLGKQTVNRTVNETVHKGVKAGLKEAGQAAVYYGKSTKTYYKQVIKDIPKDAVSSGIIEFTSSSYMKQRYTKILEV